VTELDAIRQRLEAAENAHEAQVFVDLMTDDIAVMVPDYPVQEGKAAAADFVCGMTGWMRENLERHITYRSAEVIEAGEFAFDRGTFSFTVTWKKPGASPEVVTGKYLYVYQRAEGSWKLWRVIMSTDESESNEVTT
jgi:ketosteroid isomerase-like protein